jgi:hypothetical protein
LDIVAFQRLRAISAAGMDVETPGAGISDGHGVASDLFGRHRHRRVLSGVTGSVEARLNQHMG